MKKWITVLVAILLLAFTFMLSACSGVNSMYEKVTTRYGLNETDFEHGWSNHNNGYAKDGEVVDKLLECIPNERQLIHADNEYYSFVHFGMNTMTDKEWGDGSETVDMFAPKNVDTDQWCEVFKRSGSKGVIFTAKHHDGFALWDTKNIEHSSQVRIIALHCKKNKDCALNYWNYLD